MRFINGKTVWMACAAGLGLATVAQAQDWSGPYYGGALGVGSGSYQQGIPDQGQTGETVDVGGLIYAVHAGANIQSGSIILGADAALSSGPDGAVAQLDPGEPDPPAPYWICRSGDCNVSVNTLATLRARVGYVFDRRTFIYGAAGLAIAGVEGGIANSLQQGTSTATGFTYAIGAERITSPVSSIFGEVGMFDLGTLAFGTNDTGTADFTANGEFITFRAGVNFKF